MLSSLTFELTFTVLFVPFSFYGNIIFKILAAILHLSAIILNNCELSKEDLLNQIKTLDLKILLKYYFEIGFLLNIFIFFDSKENKKKEGQKTEKEEEKWKDRKHGMAQKHYEKNKRNHKNITLIDIKEESEHFIQEDKIKDSKEINIDEIEMFKPLDEEEEKKILKKNIAQKEEKINEFLNENEKYKQDEERYLSEIKALKENVILLSKEKEKYNNLYIEKEKENKSLKKKNFEKEEKIKEEINSKNKLLEENEKKYLNEIGKYKENEKLYNKILNKDPLLKYFSPTLIGLNNIGATCFMNSTLQCLSQTKELTSYFLKENKKEEIINNNIALINKDDLQLCPIYLELVQNLWDINKPNSSFSPNDFMKNIEKMNPLFKQGQAGDSKDFIIFILEKMHTELKKPIKQISDEQKNIEPLNQYDRNNSFYHFCEDFMADKSVISDTFYGINETTNECLNCKKMYPVNNPICYNYGIFNNIIFPLEEIKNMKYNNQMQFNNQINLNTVTIYDCFCYNQKTDLFTGNNQNYCNICKQTADSYYINKIYSTPQSLILILNRGKNNMYNVNLEFYETIDITQFVCYKNTPQVFNLYGVITHIGESGPNAHFVASCKSPIDNKWYRYNDAFVNPIGNVANEVINFGTPYILFYQKTYNF